MDGVDSLHHWVRVAEFILFLFTRNFCGLEVVGSDEWVPALDPRYTKV